MRLIIVVAIFFSLFSSHANSQTIYLTRHAEKVSDGTRNPVLTQIGEQRALNLAKMLSSANIKYIYSTDYHRTQLTAQPLATYLGLTVKSYDPRDLESFANELNELDGNAWVVGHSNTTPQLTELLAEQSVKKLTESDFDDLFQVVIEGPRKILNTLKSLPNPVLEPVN